jgi:hypothetical protein
MDSRRHVFYHDFEGVSVIHSRSLWKGLRFSHFGRIVSVWVYTNRSPSGFRKWISPIIVRDRNQTPQPNDGRVASKDTYPLFLFSNPYFSRNHHHRMRRSLAIAVRHRHDKLSRQWLAAASKHARLGQSSYHSQPNKPGATHVNYTVSRSRNLHPSIHYEWLYYTDLSSMPRLYYDSNRIQICHKRGPDSRELLCEHQ